MASELGIADVVRAWRALDAKTDDERRAIARVLGFDLATTGEVTTGDPTPAPPRTRNRVGDAPSPIAVPPPPTSAEPIAVDLIPFDDVRVNPIDLGSERLGRPKPIAVQQPDSLFEPRWSRAMASTLTARSAAVGDIIVDRVIEAIATRLPLLRVPRRRRLVSATEVTIVIDERGTLAWFRADADELAAKIDVLTRASVTKVVTDGAPVLGSTESGREPPELDLDEVSEPAPPAIRMGPQGRVIAFTDLGIGSTWQRGDRQRTVSWRRLAMELRGRRASLVIVTPVPPARIDPALARLVPCVFWDRSTRPGTFRRRLKEQA